MVMNMEANYGDVCLVWMNILDKICDFCSVAENGNEHVGFILLEMFNILEADKHDDVYTRNVFIENGMKMNTFCIEESFVHFRALLNEHDIAI